MCFTAAETGSIGEWYGIDLADAQQCRFLCNGHETAFGYESSLMIEPFDSNAIDQVPETIKIN